MHYEGCIGVAAFGRRIPQPNRTEFAIALPAFNDSSLTVTIAPAKVKRGKAYLSRVRENVGCIHWFFSR